jgi:antitoxin component of RelBE/YafQ-DinJ toxin-antitoxin module
LTVRVDPEIKEAARARASALGLSMSTLVENDLRQFINGRAVVIDEDSYVPTERLRTSIESAREDIANGDYTTVTLDNLDDYFANLGQAKK